MGRAHFLCCLPARLGVLIFSLLEFLATGFLSAVFIIALIHNEQDHNLQLTKFTRGVVIAFTALCTIVALVSFAGFIGAIAKKLGGIHAYASTIGALLFVQVILSILGIVALWIEPKADFIQRCEDGKTDSDIDNVCTTKIGEVKGIATAIIIVILLLQAYQLHVVRGYARQLEQKQVNREIILGSKYELAHGEDARPLTGPDPSYPYADAAHSYGHSRGGSYA